MNDNFFYAIRIPKNIRKQLYNLSNKIKTTYSDKLKLSIPEEYKFHITLLFLGNTKLTNNQVELISQNQFEINFDKINLFGRRVIFLGIKNDTHLLELRNKIINAINSKITDNFKPHITLARIRYFKDNKFKLDPSYFNKLLTLNTKGFKADSFCLMRSYFDKNENKNKYEIIKTYNLKVQK